MKAVIVQNMKEACDIKDLVDAYILPYEHFSINYPNTFSKEDILKIKELGKEVFVMVNKNIHNNEIEALENELKMIDSLNVNGVFFYDLAVYEIKEKLNLSFPLVFSEEHFTVNYQTINYWYDKGISYAYLSSELNREEILDIIKNSKCKLFINVFGHQPMFTSRRLLTENYLKYFNLKAGRGQKYMVKENRKYPIISSNNGTTVYSDYVLNIKENFDAYLVYNSFLIPDIKKILTDNTLKEETGFLNEEVIYKVRS